MKFKEQSAQKKDAFNLVLDRHDHQLNTLSINSISKVLPQFSLDKQYLLFITEIINNVCLFQYEYALRQLYALVNVCEEGYPIDR